MASAAAVTRANFSIPILEQIPHGKWQYSYLLDWLLTSSPNGRQRLLVWLAIAATIFVAYWLCLRYLFPGYYSPVSAFHVDFYEYASLRDKTLTQILRYPRPAAYFAMKILGLGGLTAVMVNGIVVALVSVWLTIFLVRRVSGGSVATLPMATGIYAVLLFAHPDFYFEHRHDLPAEVSYLLAIGSLLCWTGFLKSNGKLAKIGLLAGAVVSAVLFVFAKETYFVSLPILMAGIAIADKRNRKWHSGYIFLLLALEATSLLWTAHLNGPFVNTHAAADNAYRIDLTPATVANTAWFYLSRLLNPFLVLAVAWPLFLLRNNRRTMLLAIAFVMAGFAALAPHAILPNHLLEEYAWVGAPLLLAPILLAGDQFWPLPRNAGVMAGLVALCLWGPAGYRAGYRSLELNFEVEQDRLGRHIARSVRRLHEVPEGSRVLVAGLDATYVPFYTESFMLTEFGEHVSWTLLTGPGIPDRKNNRVTKIIRIPDAQLDSYDELIGYDGEGNLVSVQKIGEVSAEERKQAYLLVPELKRLNESTEKYPREGYRKLLAANLCLKWGLWEEAKRYLDGAAANGSGKEPAYRQLSARLAEGLRESATAAAGVASLEARPQKVVAADGSGLVVTELVWTINPPRMCEIRIDAPDGKLFATASNSGSAKTDKWVRDGMTFFLQDVSGGKPLTRENTAAQVTVQVVKH
jgi:hypothetical protein